MDATTGRYRKRRVTGYVIGFIVFQAGFLLYWWLVPAEDFSLLVILLVGLVAAAVAVLYENPGRRRDSPSTDADVRTER